MLDTERVARYIERGTIEIAPIAFMRGRTLNDSFVILDEAQNTTSEQMKMFLTRLGFGAKAVITGDITQIDLPTGRMSGLVEAMKVVSAVEGISFVYFDERDVGQRSAGPGAEPRLSAPRLRDGCVELPYGTSLTAEDTEDAENHWFDLCVLRALCGQRLSGRHRDRPRRRAPPGPRGRTLGA